MARIPLIAACVCISVPSMFSQPAPPAPNEDVRFAAIPPAPAQNVGPNIIEGIEFRGARRFPQDTLRHVIFLKVGDAYSEDTVRRDVVALWNTSRFVDVRVSTVEGRKGGIILRFFVTERPPVQ